MRPKGSAAQLEYRRHLGARLLAQGKGVREIARWLGVRPSAVSRWKQALARGGEPARRAKPHPGGVPRLSPRQKQQLIQELGKGPRAAGYPAARWTCPRVAALSARRFGVRAHPAQVWRLLRALLRSPPRPEPRERDAGALARWRTRTWPRLKKSAAA